MPAPEIAALDDALDRAGGMVVLRRIIGQHPNAVNIDCTVRAMTSSFRLRDEEIAGAVFQDVQLVILSPTDIAKAQWPGGELAGTTVPNPIVPRRNDKVIYDGRVRNVEAVEIVTIGNEIVRFNLRLLG